MTEDAALYKLYCPKNKKYIKRINVGNGRYSATQILFSNSETSIHSEKTIKNIYKSLLAVIEYRDSLLKKPIEKVVSNRIMQNPLELISCEEVIDIMKNVEIKEFQLVENSKKSVKDIIFTNIIDSLISKDFYNRYGYYLQRAFLKDKDNKKSKKPYVYISKRTFDYQLRSSDAIYEDLASANAVGIECKKINGYNFDLVLYSEEEYNLFRLVAKYDKEYTYFKFDEMLKEYKKKEKKYKNQIKKFLPKNA